MKYISTIFLLISILLLGCDNSSDLLLNISEDNTGSSFSKLADYELIPLPEKSPLWLDSVFTLSKVIDGSVGGRIILDKYYISATGDSVIIEADLRIPAGAFEGYKTITMILDDEYAAFHFYPHMAFNDTLKLSQSFKGLNLEGYPTGTLDFVYISYDGTLELIKKNGLQVVIPQGLVRVLNAKLLHFSRYGWIKKSGSDLSVYPDIRHD